MPLIQWVRQQAPGIDQDSDGDVAASLRRVGVAASVCVAASMLLAQAGAGDDYAPSAAPPPNQVDEDFWVSGVAPVPATLRPYLQLDQDDVPILFGQPDEDFWVSGVAPVQAALRPYLQLDQDDVPILFGQPDEDFWTTRPAPSQALLRPFAQQDGEEIPAATLAGQPDEDLWNSGVAPVQAALRPFAQQDGEEIPAASLFGQSDEDFWNSGVQPVQASLRLGLPVTDTDDLPVQAVVTVTIDEDYWISGIVPTSAILRPFVQLDQDDVPVLFGQPEEDFWTTKPVPVVASLRPFVQGDTDELPIVSVVVALDEDFWQSGVAPVPASLRVQPRLETDDFAPFLWIVDEDFWISGVAPTQPVLTTLRIIEDDFAAQTIVDEDYWVSGVAPAQATFTALHIVEDDFATVTVDEDFWVSPTPTQGTFGRLYLPDPDQLTVSAPAPGSPIVDEDYWTTIPVPGIATLGHLYLPDPDQSPLLSLDLLSGAPTYIGTAHAILEPGEEMYSIIRGDLEPDMPIQVLVNGAVTDLSDCTSVVMRWKKPDNTVVTVTLVPVNASIGMFKRIWSPGDSDLLGIHRGQVVCTRSNGEPQTFPSDGSFVRWLVYDQLASGVDP